ncbi:MAG: hypothetical protein J1E40_11145 [Oscillospiraceae bacterium]|nr:hypothetical protein [Oscillospiraceae bacterium]
MKKYIICIVILSVCLVGALALIVYIDNDKNDVIDELDNTQKAHQRFYLTQIEMSNYVTEHYDDIISFSNELTADFNYEHDDIEIDYGQYKDLMDKYDLSDFYKYNDDGSCITVLSNNTVKFQYCAIIFIDYDDFRAFSFNVENGKVVFTPYMKIYDQDINRTLM